MISKLKSIYHFFLAWLGAFVYRFPSRQIYVIGVTGTKGKSTSVELLSSVLEAAGRKTALLSSVHVKVGGIYAKNMTGNTMPGRFFIQRWLRQAVDAGCQYAILEVTSQGVTQYRHRFIDFDVAAVTCLHAEHIEAHGSFEAYRDAKVQFFRDAARLSRKPKKIFLVNTDTGANAQYFVQAVLHPTGTGAFGEVVFYTRDEFVKNTLGDDTAQLGDWLSSGFNLENAAAVHMISRHQGIGDEDIIRALAAFRGITGRMEFLDARTALSHGAFKVVVDYAHTPGSFEALFEDLRRRLKGSGRLIAVFGSYGEGRDRWKRPELGKIAAKYCDEIILTNEGPGDEDPQAIVDQIAAGISAKSFSVILDRRDAILHALTLARAGDIVALVGKGHESYINLGKGRKLPWNEREVAQELLASL
jgi:UDP-N-acetylmuramoyl-L-alanyl-D-glutamate--2,6-diaminopimelate ligase